MYFLFLVIIGLSIILFIPSLIVIVWKRRPVWAFIVASIILFLMLVAPSIIEMFQAMMIYGTGDPQLIAGGISTALARALLTLPITLPVLAFIQWVARRRYKRKMDAKAGADTFS